MAAMATWTPLVLAVTLLALVTQGSAVERPLSEESKVVSALGQISRVLQCSRDVQQSSWRSCEQSSYAVRHLGTSVEASLVVQKDSLSILQDLQLQLGNSTSSLDHLSQAVASLTQLNKDLSKKITDKDTKALSGVEELKIECEAKERKVENLTQHNVDLQNQLAAEKVKVENLTQEFVNLEKQIADKDKQVSEFSKKGYKNFPGFGFYKFHPQARTWDDAVRVCRSEGTHLGIVNSVEEANVYISILACHPSIQGASYNNYFHSGFKEIGFTRQFETLDGVNIYDSGYFEWNPGEPNYSNQNCGSINHQAKFIDISCTAKTAFICELEYK